MSRTSWTSGMVAGTLADRRGRRTRVARAGRKGARPCRDRSLCLSTHVAVGYGGPTRDLVGTTTGTRGAGGELASSSRSRRARGEILELAAPRAARTSAASRRFRARWIEEGRAEEREEGSGEQGIGLMEERRGNTPIRVAGPRRRRGGSGGAVNVFAARDGEPRAG